MAGDLPRMLYAADVAVSNSFAGAQLMHRLLSKYPRDRLRIMAPAGNGAGLVGVSAGTVRFGYPRLMQTRFAGLFWRYLFLRACLPVSSLEACVRSFKPDAILTVAQTITWIAAHRLAKRYGLPLHLIVHDDWPQVGSWPAGLQQRCEALFGEIYRGAASRLCVSPYMEEEYFRRYGVRGSVLYPSIDPAVALPTQPRIRPGSSAPLHFVYAGSVNSPAMAEVILRSALAINRDGHRFSIYCNNRAELLQSAEFHRPGICVEPPLQPTVLRRTLQETADVLLLPGSFADSDRSAGALLFPTKLTDYISTGLPMLVVGPAQSAVSRWAQDHRTAAGLALEDTDAAISAAVRSASLVEARTAAVANALDFARRHLAHAPVLGEFYAALCRSRDLVEDDERIAAVGGTTRRASRS